LTLFFGLAREHVETVFKYAHFERRQGNIDGALEIVDEAFEFAADDKSRGFLIVQKAKLLHTV
jgi:hypothetical protein